MNYVPNCGFCGRPVFEFARHVGGISYHYECTQPPKQSHPLLSPPSTYISLSEDDLRKIIREELRRFHSKGDPI